jgi:two-component system, cell cycle response regulator DivK
VPKASPSRSFLVILTAPSGPAYLSAASEASGTVDRTAPRKKILIVEDNEVNLKLLNDLLEFQGYQVIATASGLDAITIAQEAGPDLILLDLQLPDVSGLDVVRRLKADAATRSITIIAVTAFAMSGDEQKGLEAGCDAYITKPINVPDFLRTIESFLGTAV